MHVDAKLTCCIIVICTLNSICVYVCKPGFLKDQIYLILKQS